MSVAPIDAAPPSDCANCGEPLAQPRPRFCPACGQETNLRAPKLGEFLQQFGGAYFATEGALWRTLKLLLLEPGELTRQYLAGRRKHYVLPLRLYLSVSVVVLLIMRAGTMLQLNVATNDLPKPRPQSGVMFSLGFGKAGLKDGQFFCENLPQWLCRRVQRRIDVAPAQLREQLAAVGERFVANLGGAMFVLVPTFAFWLRLAYLNRGLRYTEHLVFALHLHAFWFLMLALMLSNQAWLALPAFLAVPSYTWMAMRRVYGGRWWPRLLRSIAVSVVYSIVLTLVLSTLALWSLLF